MNDLRVRFQPLLMMACISLLSGCTTVRYTSTLSPSTNSDLSFGDIKVNIVSLRDNSIWETADLGTSNHLKNYVSDGLGDDLTKRITREEVMKVGQTRNPTVFSDDPEALPINIWIDRERSLLSYGYTIFTAELYRDNFSVRVTTAVEQMGLILDQTVRYRNTFSIGGGGSCLEEPWRTIESLSRATCAEAIMQALQKGDQAKMRAAQVVSRNRVDQFTLAGQTLWCKRVAQATKAPADPVPDFLFASIYLTDPASGGQPVETEQIARRLPGSGWQATPQYLRRTKMLARITAVLEGGKPVRADVKPVKEPQLEEFLDITPASTATIDEARWRTRILLQAKNQVLSKVLRESSSDELQALETKAEQAVLDATHQAELAKDRAQQAVEQGGSPGADREWSSTYNEHIAVLNAIVAAMKEELANRAH